MSESFPRPREMAARSVRELTNESLERIESLAIDQSRQAWVNGQQTRLQIFDDVLGVNAKSLRQSADYKLRERPELKRTVASLLTAVLMNIDFCERFARAKYDGGESKRDRMDDVDDDGADSGTGPRKRQQQSFDHGLKPGPSASSSIEDQASYSSALERIEKDIGSLLRFTSLLRAQSASRYLHDERANTYNPEGPGDSQKPSSETQTIAKVIADGVRREMKLEEGEEDLDRAWLRSRLQETAARRWSRISYCKHRFVERGPKGSDAEIVVRGSRKQTQDQGQPIAISGGNEPVSHQHLAVPGAPSKVSRDATTVRSGLKADPNDLRQGPLTVVTSAIKEDGIIDLAPPLRIVHQGSSWEFTCPLCRSAEIIKANSKVGFMKRWQ